MAAVFLRPHDRDAAGDFPPRLVPVEQERGQAFSFVVAGPGHQNEVLRRVGPGDEPFMALDDPGAVLQGRRRLHHAGGVGPGAGMGLGHDDGGPDLAVDDGLQPAVLLFLGRHTVEDDHVAVVGRGGVEQHGAEDGPVHFLVAGGHADDVQPLPAALLGHGQRPQALGLGVGAHFFEKLLVDVLVLVEGIGVIFQRQQFRLDENADALPEVLGFG